MNNNKPSQYRPMLAFKQKLRNNRGNKVNRLCNVIEFNDEGKDDPVLVIQDSFLLKRAQYDSDLNEGFKYENRTRQITLSGEQYVYCTTAYSIKVHSFMMMANIIHDQIGDELLTMLNKLHADVSKKNVINTGQLVRPMGNSLN